MSAPLDLALVPYEKYVSVKSFITKMPRFALKAETTDNDERETVTDMETGRVVAMMSKHHLGQRPRYQLHRVFLREDFPKNYRSQLKDLAAT